MKYRCMACDHTFESGEERKPRCPKCLTIHEVERVEESGPAAARRRGSFWIPLALIALAGAVVAYYVVGQAGQGDDATQADDAAAVVSFEKLIEESKVPKEKKADPLAAGDPVKTLASDAASGQGPKALAALFDRVLRGRTEGVWKPHHQREQRLEGVLRAGELASLFEKKPKEPFRVLSYELAALLFSMARAEGLEDAEMVEVLSFATEKKPADLPGRLGRYAVVWGEPDDKGVAKVFDPYSGRFDSAALVRALSDAQARAPYFALEGMSLLAKKETAKALDFNQLAIELDPQSPYFYMQRGLIFAASGAPGPEILAEFEKTIKMRDDAVSRANYAEMLLLAGLPGGRVEGEIKAAIDKAPDYARAHSLMATYHIMRREPDLAESELELAARLEPSSPQVLMTWAQLYASQNLSEEAIEKAQQAVRLSERSVSSLLNLATIYRGTARFEEMRSVLDEVLANAETEGMAEDIERAFGYSPDEGADAELERDAAGDGGSDGDIGSGGSLQLKLGEGGFKKGTGGLRLDGSNSPLGGSNSPLGGGLQLGGGAD